MDNNMWDEFDTTSSDNTFHQKYRKSSFDFEQRILPNIYLQGDKWIAYGMRAEKREYLGRFPSQEMAYEAQQQYKKTGIRTNVKKIRKSRYDAPTDDELQELIEEHHNFFPYDKINYVYKYEILQQVDPTPTNEHYQ